MKKKRPKKSVGKAAKGKKTKATKAAPEKSVGDLMFEKNKAKIDEEGLDFVKSMPKMLRGTGPEIEQRLKKMGIEIPPDSSACCGAAFGVGVGMMVVEQLNTLNAEVRTIRQLLEAKVAANLMGGDAGAKEAARQLKERLR